MSRVAGKDDRRAPSSREQAPRPPRRERKRLVWEIESDWRGGKIFVIAANC
jgi:hypothetical protein